jgi:flagellar biosynthetic protein FlhB
MLGITLLGWTVLALSLVTQVTAWLTVLLQRAGTMQIDAPSAGEVLLDGLGIMAAALVLPLLAYLAAPLVAAGLQNAFVWSTGNLGFKLERISPLSGLRRLASAKALAYVAKGLFKVGLVGLAVVMARGPIGWRSSPRVSCRSPPSFCCCATSSSACSRPLPSPSG